MTARQVWVVPVLAALAAGSAHAHDAYEITTEARVEAERMVLHVAMAASTAAAACLPEGPARPRRIDEGNFRRLQPALEACGRTLYAITAGSRTMDPGEAQVSLGAEEDVEMLVPYSRPPRGPVAFRATFLDRLRAPDYGAVVTVTAEREFLGQQLLRIGDPTLTVSVSPPARNIPLRVLVLVLVLVAVLVLAGARVRRRA